MKLGQKKLLNARKLGIEITKPNYIAGETLDADYDDISSIKNWEGIGSKIKDFLIIRERMAEAYALIDVPFNQLETSEQDILISYGVVNVEDSVGYYIPKGNTENAAIQLYVKNRVSSVKRAGQAYKKRIDSVEFSIAFLMFTDEEQSQTFSYAIQGFYNQLEKIALLGIGHSPSDTSDGVCNYIASDGSYINGGLKDYIINATMIAVYGSEEAALAALVTELLSIIKNGI